MTVAIYNDNHPFVADWLEDLIRHGHIAQGTVDRRSISYLTAGDVAGAGQRHFFAGIGGWSYALRRAGVPDDAPVWTGSCPCQGLSDAGKGLGFLDPRHLWPAWLPLIEQCRPPIVFGEQVASKLGLEWLDLVFSDLERRGYTVGAADLCAAGVGAPHARQRLYFVAYADGEPGRLFLRSWQSRHADAEAGRGREDGRVADATVERRKRRTRGVPPRPVEPDTARSGTSGGVANTSRGRRRQGDDTPEATPNGGARSPERGRARGLADTRRNRARDGGATGWVGTGQRREGTTDIARSSHADYGANPVREGRQGTGDHPRGRYVPLDRIPAGATRGFWGDADWLLCRDPAGGPPVARPVEPGTFPLASGVPGRVGLLSGYGNAIVPEVAVPFIRASLDSLAEMFE